MEHKHNWHIIGDYHDNSEMRSFKVTEPTKWWIVCARTECGQVKQVELNEDPVKYEGESQ